MSEKSAWIRSKRWWIRRPKKMTMTETSGAGESAHSVSRQSTLAITATASTKVSDVSAQYIIAGPSIILTAFRSFVQRAIRSPVRERA